MWQHNYEPIAGSLGASALIAALPIVVLFIMLGVLRKPAWMSATAALVSALLVSLVRAPVQLSSREGSQAPACLRAIVRS